MKKKLSDLLERYGKIALVLYFVIFLSVWAGFALAISFGFKPEGATGGAGLLGASYVATKLSQPLRIAATLGLTPGVARVWAYIRRQPQPPTTPPSPPPAD